METVETEKGECMEPEPHPVAVAIARTFLLVVGFSTLALCAALYFSGVEASLWTWSLMVGIGAVSILSACLESASGVVATVVVFFYPLG